MKPAKIRRRVLQERNAIKEKGINFIKPSI